MPLGSMHGDHEPQALGALKADGREVSLPLATVADELVELLRTQDKETVYDAVARIATGLLERSGSSAGADPAAVTTDQSGGSAAEDAGPATPAALERLRRSSASLPLRTIAESMEATVEHDDAAALDVVALAAIRLLPYLEQPSTRA